jgi:uncharacterized membrane protein required for colicin V production
MRTGLINSIFNLSSFFVSILLTGFFYKPVFNFIKNKTGFYNIFRNFMYETLSPIINKYSEKIKESVNNNLLENTSDYINKLKYELTNAIKLPSIIKNNVISKILKKINIDSILNTKSLDDSLCGNLSIIFINILSLFITFIIVSLILNIISKVLNIISFIPGLNIINHSLGLVIGFFQGVLSIWIIFLLLNLVIENPKLKSIKYMLENSSIAKFFYDSNLILKYFSFFIKI